MEKDKMRKIISILTVSTVFALTAVVANAAGYSFFGNAGYVSPGNSSLRAAQVISNTANQTPYGGIDFSVPSGLTLAGLNTLSTDYQVIQGGCGVGSPRFSVTTPQGNVFVYMGPPPNYNICPADSVWYNTGNLASPANLVDATQIGGGFYESWAQVQHDFGTLSVTDISIVLESGYAFAGGNQTINFDNTAVNSDLYTYERPVATNQNQCKNSGWQGVTRSNGTTFKNQGDCIQYVNTGK